MKFEGQAIDRSCYSLLSQLYKKDLSLWLVSALKIKPNTFNSNHLNGFWSTTMRALRFVVDPQVPKSTAHLRSDQQSNITSDDFFWDSFTANQQGDEE